ncbi:amidohydrolase [Flavitalea sp. BT771]|uniref:amidohydrolase n=1 Tax=Flavitalea sp. BT771 TaxID=3063329 RepID=UPI0026E2BF37|nr:amidohydrolase [Flavitalea sp. BT771]MDO6432434.1 amidohydrolase [Flavitalea sp. BT771]MDV6221344.1 amidohydrolase [Flavitalea sp. BT771]
MTFRTTVSSILFLILMAACHSRQSADLIVHHGLVYTMDSVFSKMEAFAVKDGKILAAGKDKDILDAYQAREVVDAGGKAIYPGLIDAHAHFAGYGQSLFAVNLFGSASMEEVVQRVQKFAASHPNLAWITGRGWDQNKFPGKAFPDNTRLNAVFANIPVMLERVDGHAAIANAKALELAGVKPGRQLTGGTVETKNGRLTGILIDNAQGLVWQQIPPLSSADFTERLLAAEKNCFAQGLTTVTDCGLSRREIEGIDSLQRAGKLHMRIYVMLSDTRENLEYYLPKGPYKTDRIYVKGVKAYADGALGSRGACLLQPYDDRPGWRGFLLNDPAHYDSLAREVAGTDFQLCTHAIGDSANRLILTVYNKYLSGKNDKRWRIEHAQVINERDFDLFGKASIIPSVQPTHATSDMYWAGERLGGPRLKGGYALKQLLAQNGWIPLGTDFPVEDISPFKTFLAAVFRVDARGWPAGGFQPENALSREEAIRGMTLWAARADCLEKEVGSLEAGKKADFIILDKDLMKIPQEEVLQTKVEATYSGGVKVHSL